jgi:hypothetical protein
MDETFADVTGGSDFAWGDFLGSLALSEMSFRQNMKLAAAQNGNVANVAGTNGQRSAGASAGTVANGLPAWLIPAAVGLVVVLLLARRG